MADDMTTVSLRCSSEELDYWRKRADRYSLPLETWARVQLIEAAEDENGDLALAEAELDSSLKLRVSRRLKARLQAAAESYELPLSAWVRAVLNRC